MSLRINQNISAETAHRFQVVNDSKMSKSIERLSSGLRINTAADDAAGLIVSETLRTQISGLDQASRNTQDGINLIKTTESSLNEIETQLRTMRDLTLHTISANGNAQSMAADQASLSQAAASINRIATQTDFAGKSLLNSSSNVNNVIFQIGANSGQTATFTLPTATYDGVALTADMTTTNLQVSAGGTTGTAAVMTAGTATAAAGVTATEVVTLTGALGSVAVTLTAGTTTDTPAEIVDLLNGVADANAKATGVRAVLTKADGTVDSVTPANNTYISFMSVGADGVTAATGQAQSITVVSNMAAGNGTGIGTSQLHTIGQNAGDIDLTVTTVGVLDKIDAAMKKVHGLRVNLGAFQANNLESTLTSLAVTKENTAASESAIRDTDMAEEMVNFTKSQILTQAAQAMLTQANQAPQNILQMLR